MIRAARMMQSAADSMAQAVVNMQGVVDQAQRQSEVFLQDFEQVLERDRKGRGHDR